MKINYTENIGTSSENTQNSVNQLKLNVQSQTDESNQYKEIHMEFDFWIYLTNI